MDRSEIVIRLGEAEVCARDAVARLHAAQTAAGFDKHDCTDAAARRAREALHDAVERLDALLALAWGR